MELEARTELDDEKENLFTSLKHKGLFKLREKPPSNKDTHAHTFQYGSTEKKA